MNNVFIDIETFRSNSEWRLKQIEDSIQAPANYGPEAAAKWRANKGLMEEHKKKYGGASRKA